MRKTNRDQKQKYVALKCSPRIRKAINNNADQLYLETQAYTELCRLKAYFGETLLKVVKNFLCFEMPLSVFWRGTQRKRRQFFLIAGE